MMYCSFSQGLLICASFQYRQKTITIFASIIRKFLPKQIDYGCQKIGSTDDFCGLLIFPDHCGPSHDKRNPVTTFINVCFVSPENKTGVMAYPGEFLKVGFGRATIVTRKYHHGILVYATFF